MKVLVIALMLLALVLITFGISPALAEADTIMVVAGWTVVYHVTGEESTQFFGDGTYLLMSQGTVYKHQTNWVYLGMLGEVTFPDGFPKITFPVGGQLAQIAVVPPPPPPITQQPTGDCIMAAVALNVTMNGKPAKVIKGTTGTIVGSANAATLQVRWDFGRDLLHGATKVVTDQIFPVSFQSVTECEDAR